MNTKRAYFAPETTAILLVAEGAVMVWSGELAYNDIDDLINQDWN